ncbi:unnamed protein product [Adineta steineri]|uniref:Calponin-homology (CH) domain-containing protein n=1 Tax=Adineta steineri TaxID=433720 RepID=A0A819EV60_9BILA|nr:unnamed protein product [Adineta steineri]CAF3858077.1 unnamed protein product [Adineta steineri]
MANIYTETMDEHKLESDYQTTNSDILAWLEAIPLSRPIHNFDTVFSDGMLIAEIIHFFFPEYIDLDIFYIARNMSQRTRNWRILKCDILPKLGLHAPGTVVHEIIHGDNRVIELFLLYLREKLEEHLIETGKKVHISHEILPPIHIEHDDHLPQLMLTPRIPRRKGFKPTFPNLNKTNDVLNDKDKEIDVLKEKLDQCEDIIKTKDERIQELEQILQKFNSQQQQSS